MGCCHSYQPINTEETIFSQSDISCNMQKKGLKSCQVIMGVDFSRMCYHLNKYKRIRDLDPHTILVDNPYEDALFTMCSILSPFNTNLYPTYCFYNSKTVLPFNKSGFGEEIVCGNKDCVIHCYQKTKKTLLDKVPFSDGTTSFTPIINKTLHISQKEYSPYILVIICDTSINIDVKESVKTIKNLKKKKIVVILLGVGSGFSISFTNLIKLSSKYKYFHYVDFIKDKSCGFNKLNAVLIKSVKILNR